MIIYFILGLLASFALVSALIALLIMFLRKNWNHANKTRLSYLVPLVLIAAITFISMSQFIPRLLDLVQLASRQYSVREVDIPGDAIPGNRTMTADGLTFYFPPGVFDAGEKGRYQITYTPRTFFIINVVRFGDVPD